MNKEKEHQEQSDAAIVSKLYEASARNDEKALLQVVDEDIRWEAMEGFPHGGTKVGFKAVFQEYFPRLMQYFAEYHAEPSEIIEADGGLVLAIGRYWGVLRTNNDSFSVPFAHVWAVQDGKVVRLRQFTDTAKLALGLIGKPLK